jgi:hypothetical protein
MISPRVWWTVLLLLASRAGSAADTEGRQYVVFVDGRVLTGLVTRQAGGYLVERDNGRIAVSAEQVRCVAPTLVEAYRLQREALVDPSAADLVKLAEWCMAYRLHDEARDELQRALRRDPHNETVRRMLSRVEEFLLTPTPPTVPPPNADGAIVPDVESLGGLSRPVAALYTARIQPLLINSCGKANCHGAATRSEFRLVPVRHDSRNHRKATEQNLAQVLSWIDVAEPQRSPLLNALEGPHGGASSPVFSGSAALAQQRLLRTWVQDVVRERRAEEARWASLPPLSNKQSSEKSAAPQVGQTPQTSQTGSAGSHPPEVASSVGPTITPPPTPRPLADAFDPELFNRRFSGPPSGNDRLGR